MVSLDMQVLVSLDLLLLVGGHDEMAVGANELARIVFDSQIHILFCIDENLFLTLQILKTKFVVVRRTAAFGTARFESASGLVIGQRVRRHLIRVVDSAGNDWTVGIAFQ